MPGKAQPSALAVQREGRGTAGECPGSFCPFFVRTHWKT
jgi:hypothetical protein